jgi:hypothetical protein
MKLRPGQQFASCVDSVKMIVIRAPGDDVVLTCGGVEMVDPQQVPVPEKSPDPAWQGSVLIGKRYADEELGIELLCTKGGSGTVAVNGVLLPIKDAKPLPASD